LQAWACRQLVKSSTKEEVVLTRDEIENVNLMSVLVMRAEDRVLQAKKKLEELYLEVWALVEDSSLTLDGYREKEASLMAAAMQAEHELN
jgi:hypothetical protein